MFALILVLCIGAALGQSDQQRESAKHMFDGLDLDGDGFITVLEMTQDFLRYDTNHNGKVSRHEYTVFICTYAPELYNYSHYVYDMYDLNHDHTLELQDYLNFFTKMDVDADGNASFDEYLAASFDAWQAAQSGTHDSIHEHGHGCH